MVLQELAKRIGARVITLGKPNTVEIDQVYCSDKISELLNNTSDTMLLVTRLANAAVMRVAELMDAPGICLVEGVDPKPEVMHAAIEHGTLLIVSPVGMPETCRRVRECLEDENEGGS